MLARCGLLWPLSNLGSTGVVVDCRGKGGGDFSRLGVVLLGQVPKTFLAVHITWFLQPYHHGVKPSRTMQKNTGCALCCIDQTSSSVVSSQGSPTSLRLGRGSGFTSGNETDETREIAIFFNDGFPRSGHLCNSWSKVDQLRPNKAQYLPDFA